MHKGYCKSEKINIELTFFYNFSNNVWYFIVNVCSRESKPRTFGTIHTVMSSFCHILNKLSCLKLRCLYSIHVLFYWYAQTVHAHTSASQWETTHRTRSNCKPYKRSTSIGKSLHFKNKCAQSHSFLIIEIKVKVLKKVSQGERDAVVEWFY